MPVMLRLLRSRPNPFTLATRVHGSSTPAPQVIQVHRVKIRRRWFKPRNIIFAGCAYYFCYQIYKSSVFGTLSAWLDEQERQLTKDEREELEEELLEPIFIPLPLTTRLVASEPYKSTDPEWKAFIRVNKNRELVRNIQSGLAELVRKAAAQSPVLVQRCGGDMKLGKYWLDIQYPLRPPPTFVRKGLTLGDDGIYITEEPIDTTTALRIRRALWPSTLTLSLWSFSGALLKQNALKFAQLLGYEPNPAPNPSLQQAMEKVHQKLKNPKPEPDAKAPSSLPSAKTQAADGSSTDSASPVEKRSSNPSPAPGSSTATPGSGVSSPVPIIPTAEGGKPKSARDIYGIKTTREHTSEPWRAFTQKFVQTWRPIPDLPPRGSIYVSGLVEITTSRALITVDVSAFWDPKTEKFDLKNANFRLRTLRMRTQTPMR
ncbi:hypothetical protein F4776DRAFT_104870 [Hypoxylon sp. NC0597]|nr:hypothetical protein F4776DRAFT_104870 [Hypoxylon sp. NC0597]